MNKSILTDVYMDENIWETLKSELSNYENIVIIYGEKALDSIKENFEKALVGKKTKFIHYKNECSYSIADEIIDEIKECDCDLVIGVGGGKAIDISKLVAEKVELPIFTVPTIASTCADVSYLSIMYNDDHSMKDIYFLKRPPQKAFINLETILKAPKKYLWAGIGDTMAKYYEMDSKGRGQKYNFNTVMGEKLSYLCKETMLNHGEHAMSTEVVDREFTEVAGVILVTTGIVSNLIDFRYNGALAHDIAGALTQLESVEHGHLHGEVVAYGILVILKLEKNEEELNKLTEFFKSIKLPVALTDILDKDEYLIKKDRVIDDVLNKKSAQEMQVKFTKEEFIKALEGNMK